MSRIEIIKKALHAADGVVPGSRKIIPKHRKMAANPFRFFRGSAGLFYRDIANGTLSVPAVLQEHIPLTMVQGDCHLSNFGFLTEEGSHGDNIIFSPNDFDDACVGSAAWDLLRFSVSLVLAQEYCDGILAHRYQSDELQTTEGLLAATTHDTEAAIQAFLQSYQQQCQAVIDNHKNRYPVIDTFAKGHTLNKLFKKAKRRAAGGKHFMSKSALAKAIEVSGDTPVFKIIKGKFKKLDAQLYAEIQDTFSPYVDDAILDIVRRIGAGTGSVNMDRFYLLVGPANYQGDDDFALCHIVEVKQQRFAAPLEHFGDLSAVNKLNPAHLTVACQRKMQRNPDMVLDEVEWQDAHWLVRSRHHARVGVAPEDICLSANGPGQNMLEYAETCGAALALAHGRSDRRSVRFEQQVCASLPTVTETLTKISLAYAEQVRQDTLILNQLLDE